MALPQEESDKKSKAIAALVTLAVATILLIVFIFYKIITPIPAIPPDPETVAVEIGIDNGSGGDNATSMGGGSMGQTGQSGSQLPSGGTPDKSPVPQTPNGAITGQDPDNPQANPSTPTPSSALLAAMSNYNKNHGTASVKVGGEGSEPYGTGIGDNPGSQTGPGTGDPGSGGPGGGNSKCSRSIVSRPDIVNPTQEEGKVMVNVYVDRLGNVKKTEVNAGGTTTLNAVLRSTATQSAYQIKFNADPTCAELIVLPIEINFTLK